MANTLVLTVGIVTRSRAGSIYKVMAASHGHDLCFRIQIILDREALVRSSDYPN